MRLLVVLVLLLVSALFTRDANAHAVLLGTSPENGATLETAPREIVLRFNEPVSPISLTIVGRGGQAAIPSGAIASRNEQVHAAVPGELQPGSYIVSYRLASADSHPISGSFLFAVGAPSGAVLAAPDLGSQETEWALLVILNRVVLLATLLFAAGGVLFATYVLGNDAARVAPLRRPLRIGALIAMTCAAIAVVLQGGLLTAADMGASWLSLLAVGWHSTLGTSAALIAFGLLLVILRLVQHPSSLLLWLGTTGAIVAGGALAASGHAATAPPRWLAAPAMAAHGLVIAFWIGSLWPLLRLLRMPGADVAAAVARFSRLAVIAVSVLIVTGLILAILQLGGDATALVTTPYGQLLLIKLSIVALLLALAAYNKTRLTPALTGGAPDGAARLARAIRLEIAAVGLILAVTTLLGQSPPPRAMTVPGPAMTAPAAAAQTVTAQARGYSATVTVTPGRTGRNTIGIALAGPDGAPFTPLEAKAEISLSEQGIAPLVEPLDAVAPGRYQRVTNGFIRPGSWLLELTVLITDFESATFELPLKIGD